MSPLLHGGNHGNYFLLYDHEREPGTWKMPIFGNLKILWSGLVMRQSLLEILGMMGNELASKSRYYNLSRFV